VIALLDLRTPVTVKHQFQWKSSDLLWAGPTLTVGGFCPRQAKEALARRGIPTGPDPTHNSPQHEEARDPKDPQVR